MEPLEEYEQLIETISGGESMNPRPWFLSLTAIWKDDPEAAQNLDATLNNSGIPSLFPQHHIEVRPEAMHTTIFAILRINKLPPGSANFRSFAKDLLTTLTHDTPILDELTQHFADGLELDAHAVRFSDSGVAIQFQGTGRLAVFRDSVRHTLSKPVLQIASSYPEETIDSLVDDRAKSGGSHAFGSIARSPSRSDLPIERFLLPMDPVVSFEFKLIHLLTSDDALTNPRSPDVEDFIIGAR